MSFFSGAFLAFFAPPDNLRSAILFGSGSIVSLCALARPRALYLDWKSAFMRPLLIRVLLHPVDYPAGKVVAGIEWQEGYSDLRICFVETFS